MAFLNKLASALNDAGVSFAVAGGYAVALHGVVRGTVDVDIVLQLDRAQFAKAEAALGGMGLKPRLPVTAGEVFDFRREYIENRNLVAWSFVNPSNPRELVDVLLTHDLAQLSVQKVRVAGDTIGVVSKRDLIAMKKAAGRKQDLEDARALESL